MSKLSYEDKINLYNDKKQGMSFNSLSKKYKIRRSVVTYLISLIDKHGFEILRTTKNRYYSIQEKKFIINRVLLSGEAFNAVALDIGLPSCGMLQNWVKKYKQSGYNIVEQKRGRSPTIMKKPKQVNKKETQEEQIKRLKEENLYLKAELEYSKKLRAVVQTRKNQQQKKK